MIENSTRHSSPSDMPLAVSPADAARMVGIGRTKLYEALGSGSLTSFKIGTRRLIRVSTLQDWLESQEASN
jgi:excisionase family DNA binding protein